jgi:hypothetical protein
VFARWEQVTRGGSLEVMTQARDSAVSAKGGRGRRRVMGDGTSVLLRAKDTSVREQYFGELALRGSDRGAECKWAATAQGQSKHLLC